MSNVERPLRTVPELVSVTDTDSELSPMEQLELSRELEAEGFAAGTEAHSREFRQRKTERTEIKNSEEGHLLRKLEAIETAQKQLEIERQETIAALEALRTVEGEQ